MGTGILKTKLSWIKVQNIHCTIKCIWIFTYNCISELKNHVLHTDTYMTIENSIQLMKTKISQPHNCYSTTFDWVGKKKAELSDSTMTQHRTVQYINNMLQIRKKKKSFLPILKHLDRWTIICTFMSDTALICDRNYVKPPKEGTHFFFQLNNQEFTVIYKLQTYTVNYRHQ